MYVHSEPKGWAKWLALIEWWYNTTYHSASQMPPYEVVYNQPLLYIYLIYQASHPIPQWTDQCKNES